MYIEKINITNFGRMHDREITFSPGVNVIEGENESGKTTIASFIVFILYGLKSSLGRTRYISWGASSVSGSLIAVTDGGRILIERTAVVGAKDAIREAVRMTDIETGLELHRGKCPGEAIFGVPEDVFTSTAFVRQLSGGRFDGEKMSAAAENLLFSADEAVNTEKAAEKIDMMRRQLLHKNGKGGSIYEKETAIASLNMRLENAKRSSGELINVEAAIADLTEKREVAVTRREAARLKAHNFETLENLRRFDRLVELKDNVAKLYGEKDALLSANMNVYGHFPDDAYIGELRAVADGMSATSASIATVSRQLDDLRSRASKCPDKELYDRLMDDENTADDIVSDAESLASRRSVSSIMAVMTLLFACVCAVLAVYFRDSGTLFMVPLAAASAVFASAAAIAAAISISAGSKIRRELRRYNAGSIGELREVLEESVSHASEFRRVEEDIAAAEAELYVQYSVYDDEAREARELLSQRGVSAEGDALGQALSDTISACESICSRDHEITDEIERGRAEIGGLERQLSGVSEGEVRSDAEFINAEEFASVPAADLRREREFTENVVLRLTEHIHELEVRRAQLAASREDPAALSVAVDTLTRELAEDRARLDACVLAIDALSAAGRGVRESVAPQLRAMAREYLGRISGGKYTELGVDTAFGLTVSAEGAYRDVDLLSDGTEDAAYLSLRLSLVRLLFRRELPPLIFDEAFSQMDDKRTHALLSLISESGGPQSLILTCQGRESRLLSDDCLRISLSDLT